MATSGPNQGGTATEVIGIFEVWTNPSFAVVDNNAYATVTMEILAANHLDIKTFGTFLGVNAADVVTHVTVETALKVSTGTVKIANVQLIKADVVVGSVKSLNIQSSSQTEVYISSGALSVADDFVTTLVGSDLTSAFGVRIQYAAFNSLITLSVDAVRLTLTGMFTGMSFAKGTLLVYPRALGFFEMLPQRAKGVLSVQPRAAGILEVDKAK